MRAKVWIDVHEPLHRVVLFNSLRRKQVDRYGVLFERLPYFCFACGRLGHPDTHCHNPLPRKADGSLEYDARIRFSETKKKPSQASAKVQAGFPPKEKEMGKTTNAKTNEKQMNKDPRKPVFIPRGNTGQVKNAVFQFNAAASGTYVEKAKASGPSTSAATTEGNPLLSNHATGLDLQGIKRNAILNSPSKVGGEPRDPKKKKSPQLDNGDMTIDNTDLAEAEDQPRQDQ